MNLAEQWALRISDVITEAKLAGVDVTIENDCCGCSKMSLVASVGTDFTAPDYIESKVAL